MVVSERLVRLKYGEVPQWIPLGKDGKAEALALKPRAVSGSQVEIK